MILEARAQARANLWRHSDFLRLWIGQTISSFGSQIGGGALRLTAILLLSATPVQLGLLTAAGLAPTLLFGLFAGVWVDRLRRRPILIAADLGRALLLLAIPLAFVFGWLRMELIYVVAAATGVLATFFDVAYHAFLPQIVSREQLVEGNSKLGVSDSVAEIAGPPLGGVLVQAIGGPWAVLADAVSFLFSACAIGSTRAVEQLAPAAEHEGVLHEALEGLRAMKHSPVLLGLLLATTTQSFAGGIIGTLYDLFLIRELGMPPAVVGLTVGVGGIAALGGALLTERLVARLGSRRTLNLAMLFTGVNILIPLAHGPLSVTLPMVLLAQSADIAMAVAMITALSMRQETTPERLMGRVNAGFTVVPTLALLAGALVGGQFAEAFGVRATLMAAVLILSSAVVWVWRMREER